MRTVKIDDKEIQVNGVLGTYEKQAIIDVAISESVKDNGTISRLIYDAVFYALVIQYYTDYNIKELSDNVVECYDIMEQKGILSKLLSEIAKCENSDIKEFIEYSDLEYHLAVDRLNSSALTIETILKNMILGNATQEALKEIKK